MPGHCTLLEWAHQDALKRGYEEKNQKIFKSTRAQAERAVGLGTRRGFSGRGSPVFSSRPEKHRKEESPLVWLPTEESLGGPPVCTVQQTWRCSSFVSGCLKPSKLLVCRSWKPEGCRFPVGPPLFSMDPGFTCRSAHPWQPATLSGEQARKSPSYPCRLPLCGLRDPVTAALLFVPKPQPGGFLSTPSLSPPCPHSLSHGKCLLGCREAEIQPGSILGK